MPTRKWLLAYFDCPNRHSFSASPRQTRIEERLSRAVSRRVNRCNKNATERSGAFSGDEQARVKNLIVTLVGIVLSALFIAGVGILTIQKIGVNGGAVFGLDNQLAAVSEPGPALAQLSAIAVLSALVIFAMSPVIHGRTKARPALMLRLSFCAATVIQVAITLVLLSMDYTVNGLEDGFPPWWQGWLEAGGSSPAVHVTMLVVIVFIFLNKAASRPTTALKEGQRFAEPAAASDS